jgi:hypothetical protein
MTKERAKQVILDLQLRFDNNQFYNPDGHLITAAKRGEEPEVIKWLIDHGATALNKALYVAASMGKTQVMQVLIEVGADDVNGALKWASQHCRLDAIKFLIDKGATNLEDALYALARSAISLRAYDKQPKMQFIDENGNDVSPACHTSDKHIVDALIYLSSKLDRISLKTNR